MKIEVSVESYLNSTITMHDKLCAEAREAREKAIVAVQLRCKHQEVAEAPCRPSEIFEASPPFRVCLQCGLSEDGWGDSGKLWGFNRRKCHEITREEGYSVQRKVRHPDTKVPS